MLVTQRTFLRRFAVLAGFLFAAAGAFALQPFPPEGTPVVEIDVRGTERTDPQRIRTVMQLQPGVPFTREAQRRDQQAIANLGDYNPLAIRMASEDVEGGVRLTVEVQENEVINRIIFVGNVQFTTQRLVRELDYAEGGILPTAAKEKTVRTIRGFYSQGGFKNASVRVSVDPVPDMPGQVNVTIAIDEGEKIRIRDLIIEGNRHFPDWRVRTWAVNSGSWLFFDNYYDDRAFDDDLRVIEDKYRAAGFLDAKASRGEFVYNQEKAWVSPVVVIEEGPRYKVKAVRFSGSTLFTDAELLRPFEPFIGKTYDGYKVSEALRSLGRLYGDQGYVNAVFDGDYEKHPAQGDVVLKIAITENNAVTIGNIDVKVEKYDYHFELNKLEEFIDWTSPGLKEETVMREVTLKPGATYRTADEVRTVDRLRNLGFIEDVKIQRKPTADPDVVDVVVDVEEDPSAGFVSVTAGVGEESGPAVGAQYVNPNLFGDAKVLRLGATVGSRVHSFSATYFDRHFMGTDNTFEQTLFRSYARYPGYAQRIYGSSTELGHPVREDLRVYMRLRLEHVRLERRESGLFENMNSYGVAALRGMIARDVRNNRRWPTEGYYATAGIEPGWARHGMLRLTHSFEWYKALSRDEDWVYAYGHVMGLQPYNAYRVGITERFFVGGTSTLRGFRPRGIGPTDDGEHDVHVGGSTMLTQRHELRHRFSRMFQGRLFVDAGFLEDHPLEFGPPRVGAGAGVTVDLGAFSLDLDLAAPVVKYRHDRTRSFHFRLRSNF